MACGISWDKQMLINLENISVVRLALEADRVIRMKGNALSDFVVPGSNLLTLSVVLVLLLKVLL